jgi:hypothetical protein
VRPNTDALVSTVLYDVSHDDLEITVPQVDEGRYYSISFYDPYGTNFEVLGTFSDSAPGSYLLSIGPSDRPGVAQNSSYQGLIYSPTTFGSILLRILVRNRGDDVPVALNYSAQFDVQPISRDGLESGPAFSPDIFANTSSSEAESILESTARFSQALPYGNVSTLEASEVARLNAAGIDNGTYDQPDCVNLTQALAAVEDDIAEYRQQPDLFVPLGNNWSALTAPDGGSFADTVLGRAWIADYGYLALNPTEATYLDLNLNLTLQHNESYLFAFSGRPPLRQTGFWSLTMYSQDGYLVDNLIDRYTIGDRNNITYPNGTRVYADGGQGLSPAVTSIEDDPFHILIQTEIPPNNWTSNWLPAPQEAGPIAPLLRWYGALPQLLDGSYAYPVITKMAAFTTEDEENPSPTESGTPTASESGAASATGEAGESTDGSTTHIANVKLVMALAVISIIAITH